jgi:hypothetical protein
MNPRNVHKKLVSETISGFGREHKFYFATISNTWFKIHICDVHAPNVFLMF